MKKIPFLCFLSVLAASIFAQAPDAFNYQAVLRDGAGQVNANGGVSIEIEILHGSATGASVFSETHSATSNSFGLGPTFKRGIEPDVPE